MVLQASQVIELVVPLIFMPFNLLFQSEPLKSPRELQDKVISDKVSFLPLTEAPVSLYNQN